MRIAASRRASRSSTSTSTASTPPRARRWRASADGCGIRPSAASPSPPSATGSRSRPARRARKRTIDALLPRTSRFSRKVAGELTEEQVVAANIDTVFLVSGLDHDFNLRRIERYLTTAWDGGARPVILLNKADLVGDIDAVVRRGRGDRLRRAGARDQLAREDRARRAVRRISVSARPVAFLGSSGVGKSTLINALLGDRSAAHPRGPREAINAGATRRRTASC